MTAAVRDLESWMLNSELRIVNVHGSRKPGDRTQRVAVGLPDSTVMVLKWANAPRGGAAFNNEPRYEAAAYQLQKMFLDEPEYVVPPTVLRTFPLSFVSTHIPGTAATWDDAQSVLVVLSYWLSQVTPDQFWDEKRAQTDTVYARYLGNMNILTYLIRHSDGNVGNFLISSTGTVPRLFSVDNGVSFRSPPSDRGLEWRSLRVKRLPAHTVERLRALSPELLRAELGVLAEFEVRDGQLVAAARGVNLDPRRGVRRRDGRVQIGLTEAEIGDVVERIQRLLERIDRGQIGVM